MSIAAYRAVLIFFSVHFREVWRSLTSALPNAKSYIHSALAHISTDELQLFVRVAATPVAENGCNKGEFL